MHYIRLTWRPLKLSNAKTWETLSFFISGARSSIWFRYEP
jgi:hypothetical protein